MTRRRRIVISTAAVLVVAGMVVTYTTRSSLQPIPDSLGPTLGDVRRARLLDRRGLPIADGTPVLVTTTASTDTVRASVAGGAVDVTVVTGGGGDKPVIRLECRGKKFDREIGVDPDAATAIQSNRPRLNGQMV